MRAPITLEYNSHLRAIPSIHGRVMFCVLVQQACAEYQPDAIAVELPPSLGEATRKVWKSLNKVRGEYPPLLMLAQLKQILPRSLAEYAQILPIGPGDSLIEAVRCGLEYDIPVEFIDSESRPDQHWKSPAMPFMEDGMLLEEGFDVFYSKVRDDVQSTRIEEIDAPREEYMASQLKRLLENKKRVLLVCGAVHWEPICELLDGARRLSGDDNQSSEREPVKVLCTGTTIFSEYNSDLPAVVFEYEKLRRRGKAQNFNHEKAWQNILKRILKRLEKIEEGPNPREFMNFFELLNRLCIHTGHLFPSLLHLYHASQSCGSEALSQVVCEESMRYPAKCPSASSLPLALGQLTGIQLDGDGISAKIDGQPVLLVSRRPLGFIYAHNSLDTTIPYKHNGSDEPRGEKKTGKKDEPKLRSSTRPPTLEEIKQYLRDSYFKKRVSRSRPWPDEVEENYTSAFHELHHDPAKNTILPWPTDEFVAQNNKMGIRARILARIKTEKLSSVEVNGVYRGTPDIRRIIQTRARGDDRMYIKAIHMSRLSSMCLFEGFDPIVWIFHPYDRDRESKRPYLLPTNGVWYIPAILYGELIPQYNTFDVGYLRLGGFVSFTPDYTVEQQSRLVRWMQSGNRKHVPISSTSSWSEKEHIRKNHIYDCLTPEEKQKVLSPDTHEILVLTAIRYARRYVIWISDEVDKSAHPFRSMCRDICRRQRKSLICLNLNDFPPDDIEALRNFRFRVSSDFIDWAANFIYSNLQGMIS